MTTLSSVDLDSRWLRRYLPRPGARLSLVVLAHAGGNASFFRPWARLLPAWVELVAVQYPGRMDRLGEAGVSDMDTLGDQISDALRVGLRRPYALFGHSLGASVAYEVALRLQRDRPAQRLFVSGRPAPRLQHPGVLHLASDDELWRHAAGLGGTGADLAADAEVRALALPALRNDFRLAETYAPGHRPALTTPVCALLGADDQEVSPVEAQAWGELTTAGFELHQFSGGHFYLIDEREALLAVLIARLAATT